MAQTNRHSAVTRCASRFSSADTTCNVRREKAPGAFTSPARIRLQRDCISSSDTRLARSNRKASQSSSTFWGFASVPSKGIAPAVTCAALRCFRSFSWVSLISARSAKAEVSMLPRARIRSAATCAAAIRLAWTGSYRTQPAPAIFSTSVLAAFPNSSSLMSV